MLARSGRKNPGLQAHSYPRATDVDGTQTAVWLSQACEGAPVASSIWLQISVAATQLVDSHTATKSNRVG